MSGDRNRTIRLTIDMTYNAEQMHYDDPEGIRWFNEEVLGGALQMWSDEIGDWIGSVQIVEPPAPEPPCSVCGNPAQPSLTINLLPVCTNCVRTGTAFNKEKA